MTQTIHDRKTYITNPWGRKHEMTRSIGQRAAAAAGALALAVAGVLVAAAPASAALPANIDNTQDGSSAITVHKHAQPNPAGDAGDGTEITGGLPDPLEGVEFSLYRLTGIELTTDAGWDTAEAISEALNSGAQPVPNADPATSVTIDGVSYPVTGVATQETGSDGATTFGALDFGIYLIVEGADNGGNNITNTAAPFIVSVPFATGEDTWLYQVHAYPKNSVTEIEKSVNVQEGLGLGSVVEFPVTVAIPHLAPDTAFTSFVVSDTLDSRLGEVGVTSVTVNGVEVDEDYYEIAVDGQTVRVVFTAEGLTWLLGQTGNDVVVTFEGAVEEIGDGVITNDATVYINDPDEDNGFGSNEVRTNWGDLKILKTDSQTPATGLQGAQFQVFAAADPYAADCTAATPTGSALSVDGETTFISDVNGDIVIAGLFVSDSVNAPIDAAARCYVVVETVAPVGYQLPDPAAWGVAVTTGVSADVDITIVNEQVPPWELPLTGGNGTLWFAIGGVALLSIALGAAFLVARRKKALA